MTDLLHAPTDTDLAGLAADVAAAARIVAPSWPLSSTIAVNPLSGYEDRPFADGIGEAATRFGTRGHLTLAELRAAFAAGRVELEHLQAALARQLPGVDADATSVLLTDLLHGPEEPPTSRAACTIAERVDHDHGTDLRNQLDLAITDWCAQWAVQAEPGDLWVAWRAERAVLGASLAEQPLHALAGALADLGIPAERTCDYLERHVAALPGWVAHLRWRDAHLGGESVVGFLAACLTLEAQLLAGAATYGPEDEPATSPADTLDARRLAVLAHADDTLDAATVDGALALLPERARPFVWLDAYEHAVHDPLLRSLTTTSSGPTGVPPRAEPLLAQVVCCIDVRSEGLRRHLEAVGPYETFGYAGFFGLPARFEPLTGGTGTDQLPVLLRPSVTLREVAAPGHEAEAARAVEHGRTVAAMDDAWKAAKVHPIAPLALAEGTGWAAGALAALRTAAPGLAARLADALPHGRASEATTTFDRTALDLETQADIVGAILGLGIGARPAPIVVLCGHAATVDNNPLESGLACGACGGNGGAVNARAVAEMANDPAVQRVLSDRATPIPEGTWFLAAVHDTPSDTVALLDADRLPLSHRDALGRLVADLEAAGRAAALERAGTLPGGATTGSATGRLARTRRRARDWAEPVAELGLAGNMAFVVGPRSLTRGLDLGRRVFLHSYEATTDGDGAVLTGILTAPLVVAQWINAQYYFSTTDPEHFGAGTKAVHNVLGDVGLLSGASGDLRRGLPLQSVRAGDRLLHEPVRLLAVVQGSLAHVDAAIAGSETLRSLVEHEWIHLVARADETDRWWQRRATGWAPRAGVADPVPAAA